MHERKLIETILAQMSQAARDNGATRVSGARLRLPSGGHLESEGFSSQFELASRGTIAQGAALDLVFEPMADEHAVIIETLKLEIPERKRLRLALFGAVQGVGFRPFIHHLARELGLGGWVKNSGSGVLIEAEGPEDVLRLFSGRVISKKPKAAVISASEETWLAPLGEAGFSIQPSPPTAEKSAWLLPDLGTCPDCLKETMGEGRRGGYPFTNCTRCGPRFTIITAIPYDRANTTMTSFSMCSSCAAEYSDPLDRRFHAQPIACPDCGPRLWLEGGPPGLPPIEAAARLIEEGRIVAVKGLGGFHLFCDARSRAAVRLLRERKLRPEKPFALMFPTLDAVREACELGALEESWLLSPAAPIVLLRRSGFGDVADEVAPGRPDLGAFLPSTPLHHLLMRRLNFPVVATSGNVSDEPIAKDNEEARARLSGIADAFLLHDRPIARHADDSIVRLSRGRQSLLRRARGLAPLPLRVARSLKPVLALGAHLKSTVSIAWDRQIVTSQHLGDLDTVASWEAFQAAVKDLCALYDFKPELVACDLHPDYRSSVLARSLGLPLARIQHHHAHVAACMAEQDVAPPALGVAWDGIGLGSDGELWGGEFLIVDEKGFRRFAHLRPFPLPGAAAAVREPRRSALGLLWEARRPLERLRPRFGEGWGALRNLPADRFFSPRTTSVGRLFDAVSSLLGLVQVNSFEGQGAMALENVAAPESDRSYAFALNQPASNAPLVADWGPMLERLLVDLDSGAPIPLLSARFHDALAALVLAVARRAGLKSVVLSGGVFQNAALAERTAALLEQDGFAAFTHQRLPPNDGGISAGQAFLAGLGWY